jgi:hypothetical protein
MTIFDLTVRGAIEIQGKVVVKQIDEVKEKYNILVETDSAIFTEEVMDMEIKFMYCENNSLVIEV